MRETPFEIVWEPSGVNAKSTPKLQRELKEMAYGSNTYP
jgi:hypothetical protein